MFTNSKVNRIPFSINLSDNQSYGFRMDSVFYGCSYLTELPYIENAAPTALQYFCASSSIQQIPENYFDNWNWSIMKNMTSAYDGYGNYIFY